MKTRKFTDTELAILRRNRLSKIDLMISAYHILKHNNISTLGKLIQHSEEELRGLKGYARSKMSKTVLEHLKDELQKIGLHLRTDD